MKRIAIIGCGGAGKSTLARKLGQLLGMEVFHLDALYWKPGWVETQETEWHEMQHELVKRESWIIDGNYGGSMDIRLAAADTVVFLDFPRAICLWRALKRLLHYHGGGRPDIGPGCPEKIDMQYVKWIWEYRRTRRASVMRRIESCSADTVVILGSPREARRFLRAVKKEVQT